MKRLISIVVGLLLTTSLTTKISYGQKTPEGSPQNSPLQNSSPTSPKSSPKSSPNRKVVRDAKGQAIGEIVTDTENNLVFVRFKGIYDGLNVTTFNSGELWLVVLLTIIFGGFGGFVFELLNLQGNIEKRHEPSEDELAAKLAYATAKNVIDLGCWARVIVGAAAAPPAILFLQPESAFGLLAMSIVAGSAGTAIFRSLQERLLMVVNQKENEKIKLQVIEQYLRMSEAVNAYTKLKEKLLKESNSPKDTTDLEFNGVTSIKQEELDEIEKQLSEAKGLCELIIKTSDSSIPHTASKPGAEADK